MQRQLRLGDILDDYCPRERRVTNHAVVAMLGADVKQTRCTTCEAEHEYKQAKVPRQRRKAETPAALYAAVLSGGPKRVAHGEPLKDGAALDAANGDGAVAEPQVLDVPADSHDDQRAESAAADDVLDVDTGDADASDERGEREGEEDGPVHRPLIRASLPRPEGTPPPQRPGPDFTIRQPGGRPANRFRGRNFRGGQPFQGQGNRGNGNVGGPPRGGMMRQGGGRPQGGPAPMSRRNGPGRKRQK